MDNRFIQEAAILVRAPAFRQETPGTV
jgi:hypothetical protein